MTQLHDISALLGQNSYPGRGIALGLTPDGKTAALAYFIMGRSINSRSRVFFRDGDNVSIRIVNPDKAADSSLILYTPVRTLTGATIVTNGDQTDTIRDALLQKSTFEQALAARTFEPDAPHYTPRISGIQYFDKGFSYKLAIVKSADPNGAAAVRETFAYEPIKGSGHLIHTYRQNASPLPSFAGEPASVAIPADIDAFALGIWNGLNSENRISLYVRYTDIASGTYTDRLFNKYGKHGQGQAED